MLHCYAHLASVKHWSGRLGAGCLPGQMLQNVLTMLIFSRSKKIFRLRQLFLLFHIINYLGLGNELNTSPHQKNIATSGMLLLLVLTEIF